ncbi:MAG TPA: 50S ribosomal protein L10 [Acidimicrobiales bacterium]|nr:50S ribosomal protein L10 [Acidimicrobiales bacterium]
MENPRPEKVAVVDEVRQHFDEADAAILTEYRGLKVKELGALRRALAPSGGDYRIYKNTLVRFAARDAGLEGLDALLTGPTAIAFVKGDAAAVAKSLRDYARTQPLLVIKGGVLGSKVLSSAETNALADLPSREVLLARFAGALAAPLQQLAGLMQALPRNLAYGLAALRDQRAEAGDTSGDAPAADASPEADAAPVADAAPAGDAAPVADAAPAGDADSEAQAAAEAVTESPAAAAGTPEAEVALDDATSPALAAEAADPAPSE